MKRRKTFFTFSVIALLLAVSQPARAISLNVGDTYTCDIGTIDHLQGCQWTISDPQAMEFVSTPGAYDTRVTVRALAAQESTAPVIVHCKYYWLELDPTTGRYIYSRSDYKDFNFFIHAPDPTGVTITPSSMSLNVGDQGYLSATVLPQGANQTVTWSSTDYGVVDVNSVGHYLVTGPGEANIIATAVNGKKGYCIVSVSDPGPTSIEVRPASLSLYVGEKRWLTATVYPSTADQMVYWDTDDRAVATVSNAGQVEATGPGDTYVTASTVNGRVARCSVHVNPVPPTSIRVTPVSVDVAIGETRTLYYDLTPSNASSAVTWSCSPQGIAAVNSSTGAVTGKAEGKTTVTATTANGLSSSCEVTVYKALPTRIELAKSSATMLVGDSEPLSYTVTPSYAIYSVEWETDHENVVQVSQSGQVTAVGSGTATITVTTDNGKSSSCIVTVPPQPAAVVLSKSSLDIILGRKAQLTYALQPEGARARSVSWASSNPQVCSVGQDGSVYAHRPGTATVTATTDNGVSGSCLVTVPKPLYQLFVWRQTGEKDGYLSTDHPEFWMEGNVVKFKTDAVTLSIPSDELDRFTLEQVLPEHPTAIAMPASFKVGLGRSRQLGYTLTPADAVTTLTWLNAAPDVVSVAANGLVEGLQVGTAMLTAQTSNGLRATCQVVVPEPQWKLYVWRRSGLVDEYLLDEHPEAVVEADLLTLTTTSTTIGYPIADVLYFTLDDSSVIERVAGDVNGDRVVDVADIATIISCMAGGSSVPVVADVNGDGTVDVADIANVISIMAEK